MGSVKFDGCVSLVIRFAGATAFTPSARSTIDYWHDTVVYPSVRSSVTLCIVSVYGVERYGNVRLLSYCDSTL